MAKLNIGCGRTPREGWVNVDLHATPGVIGADLNDCAKTPLPFPSNTFDTIRGSHVLEHIPNILPLMEELYRVAKPHAVATFHVPYGSSDDAYEDPTHVRPYFRTSWLYYAQPAYWRADYGYRGDWQTEVVLLTVKHRTTTLAHVDHRRNVVKEMTAKLQCIKPLRAMEKDLLTYPSPQMVLSNG